MNQEQAKALLDNPEINKVFRALADGKQLQENREGEWLDASILEIGYPEIVDGFVRIKPEPKLRPFTAREVIALGDVWLRSTDNTQDIFYRISAATEIGITVVGDEPRPIRWVDDKINSLQFTVDGGATWKPFGVLE